MFAFNSQSKYSRPPNLKQEVDLTSGTYQQLCWSYEYVLTRTACAPIAIALKTSVPRRTPPSSSTGTLPFTAWTIYKCEGQNFLAEETKSLGLTNVRNLPLPKLK